MNIAFAGTPEFSVCTLKALISAGHDISMVFTQPDRPAGRGKKITMSPVKLTALEHGLRIEQPRNLKHYDLSGLDKPDLMVVVAYGLLLPQSVLNWPHLGCINVHASLLPRWRGAAPIQRAIEAGDRESGVCIMQMDAGLDTGDVIGCARVPLSSEETGGSLHDKLAVLGAEKLVESLDLLGRGKALTTPQPKEGTTYAEKLRKDEAPIHWEESAKIIERRIRAFNPWPSTWTYIRGITLKIHLSVLSTVSTLGAKPGTILRVSKDGFDIATGDGALKITQVQPAGKKPMAAADFVNGYQIKAGETLG